MGDIAQRGNRLTFAKGGTVRRPKKPSTHGKDVPTMAAKGGRIGLKKGGRPWGTGPKPGTLEFLQHTTQTPRKKKAVGGVIKKVIQAGKKGVKKISDAARKKDTADRIKVFEHAGPHEGEVITKRILGKGTKKGDRTKAAVKDAMEAKPWVGKPHAAGGRIGKAIGGSIKKIAKTAAKRWKKKKVYPETEDLTHQVGPYVGDVGSERPGIKRRGWGKKPGQKKPDREHVPYERHGAKKGGKADKN